MERPAKPKQPEGVPFLELDKQQKIDVLKLVYTEEGEFLRFETTTAQRLVTLFGTIQLALGAWSATHEFPNSRPKWFLFGLNFAFGAWVSGLVILNYRRREEVVGPQRRALQALRLMEADQYLGGQQVHVYKHDTAWKWWYVILVMFFCAARYVPLFEF